MSCMSTLTWHTWLFWNVMVGITRSKVIVDLCIFFQKGSFPRRVDVLCNLRPETCQKLFSSRERGNISHQTGKMRKIHDSNDAMWSFPGGVPVIVPSLKSIVFSCSFSPKTLEFCGGCGIPITSPTRNNLWNEHSIWEPFGTPSSDFLSHGTWN